MNLPDTLCKVRHTFIGINIKNQIRKLTENRKKKSENKKVFVFHDLARFSKDAITKEKTKLFSRRFKRFNVFLAIRIIPKLG